MPGAVGDLGQVIGQDFALGEQNTEDMAAKMAAGRGLQALQALNQNPMLPGSQPAMPGAAPMPPGPPMAGGPGMGAPSPQPQASPPMGGPQPGMNPPAQGAVPPGNFAARFPQAPPQAVPYAQLGQGQAQAPPQAAPPPPPPQQQPQQMPQMPMGGSQQGPPDLQQIIAAVDRANPGAPPNVKLAAIQMLTRGILNPQQQLAFREMQLMQRQDAMGMNAMLKLQQINTQRQMQGLPPLTFQEAMGSGMIGGGGQQQQGQPSGQQQQPNDLFSGIDPAKLERANNLGWDRNALQQAGTVYQQSGKWPQGLGTRPQAQIIQGIIRDVAENINKQKNITDADMTKGWQQYVGDTSYQRTAGTMGARVENATNEVKQLLPQALQSSQNLPRGQWVPFNKLYQDWQAGKSDPSYNDFVLANQSLLNAYVRAMNPQGNPRVADRLENHAIGLLSIATSPEAYRVQVERLWKEVLASQKATGETREGRQPPEQIDINAPLPSAPAAPSSSSIPKGWSVEQQ